MGAEGAERGSGGEEEGGVDECISQPQEAGAARGGRGGRRRRRRGTEDEDNRHPSLTLPWAW